MILRRARYEALSYMAMALVYTGALTGKVGADHHGHHGVRGRPVHDGAGDDLGHVERVGAAAGGWEGAHGQTRALIMI